MALKLARYATGRFKTVSMWDSFHGASLDAISVGGEALFREGLGPLLPGCLHVPPYSDEGIGRDSADYVEYVMDKERDIAAVVAEPMRWTTVVPPPTDYWRRIRTCCDRHGALLVIDEIPACLGRTGRMFCCQHFDLQPDILVIGKGLGGGLFPLAAVIARGDLNVAPDRALGHYTHEKSPVGAAAALATLEVIEQQQLVSRAQQLGGRVLERLREQTAACPLVHQARGLGLQLAVELRRGGRKAEQAAEAVLYRCLELGLSFKVSDGNVLSLSPPLTVSDREIDAALEILESALEEQGSQA
jgi:4-aminobutyrate aminotransferase